MKTMRGLFSLAVIFGGMISSVPASADVVYHRVYRQPVTISDPFSILDRHHNNALRPEEYKRAGRAESFRFLDRNKDGFLSRLEFYGTEALWSSLDDLNTIMPAADGNMTHKTIRADIVYENDQCDVPGYRNNPNCR